MDALPPNPSARVITGEGSNFQLDEVAPFVAKLKRRGTRSKHVEPLRITHTRAVFDKNRCTVGLVSGASSSCIARRELIFRLLGNPDAPEFQTRRRRTYMVASDLSDESSYALQWAIGTILRDGDELLFVTVLETEEKRAFSLPHTEYLADVRVLQSTETTTQRTTRRRNWSGNESDRPTRLLFLDKVSERSFMAYRADAFIVATALIERTK